MTEIDVLIRKPTPGSDAAVGRIVEKLPPNRLLVDWGDGAVVEEKLGKDFVPSKAGSLRYLQYTDAESLERLLRESAEQFFTLVLADLKDAKTPAEIQKAAISYGLDQGQVEESWKTISKRLGPDSLIRVVKESNRSKYRLKGGNIPYVDVEIPESRVTPTTLDSTDFVQPEEPMEVAELEETTSEVAETRAVPPAAPLVTELPLRTGSLGMPERSSVSAATRPDFDDVIKDLERGPLSEQTKARLRELGSLPQRSDALLVLAYLGEDMTGGEAELILQQPLQTVLELARRPNKAIERAFSAAQGKPKDVLRRVLVAHPAAAGLGLLKESDFEEWARSESVALLAKKMLTEVIASHGDERGELGARLTDAISRLLTASPKQSRLGRDLLVGVLAAIAPQGTKDAAALRDLIVSQLLGRNKSSALFEAWDKHLLSRLASGLAPMPFEKHGGRSQILAAIHRSQADALLDAQWWPGLTFDVLAENGDGVLIHTLEDESVFSRFARPLIEEAVAKITSRRALMRFLGSSTFVVAHVDDDVVMHLFRSVARNDTRVNAWVDALSQRSALEQLREQYEDARQAVERAEASTADTRQRLSDSERITERLNAQLAEASGAHKSMREQERRQLQIDVVRSMAQLAVLVEGESSKLEPAMLVQRVKAFLRRVNLQPIGVAGEASTFDAALHEETDGRPADGSPVIVVRPGYTWNTPDEALVVVKAKVSAT